MSKNVYFCKYTSGDIISLGLSDDFAIIMELNQENFLIDNLETFESYYVQEQSWLSRFILGKKLVGKCIMNTKLVTYDPWWGASYEGKSINC